MKTGMAVALTAIGCLMLGFAAGASTAAMLEPDTLPMSCVRALDHAADMAESAEDFMHSAANGMQAGYAHDLDGMNLAADDMKADRANFESDRSSFASDRRSCELGRR